MLGVFGKTTVYQLLLAVFQAFIIRKCLFSHSLDGPFLLAQRATVVLLHPQRHAAVVEGVVAFAPYDHAVLFPVEVLLTLGLTP